MMPHCDRYTIPCNTFQLKQTHLGVRLRSSDYARRLPVSCAGQVGSCCIAISCKMLISKVCTESGPNPGCNLRLTGSCSPRCIVMGATMQAVYPSKFGIPNIWLLAMKDAAVVQEIMFGLFPGRIDAFGKSLLKHKQHLVNYMIFLRVTPFLPSWFINTASPVAGFPFREYLLGTAVGLQPLNFILVQAGQTLGQLHSYRDLYSIWNISKLGACAVLAVSPVLYQRLCSRTPRKRSSFRTARRTISV